jgi:hypothetical protein
LSIENLCFVIRELLNNATIPSGVYQVADDESLSTNKLIALLSGSLNKKQGFKIPQSFIKKKCRIRDILSLPINSERLGKLTENFVVSNHKIKRELARSLPVTSEEGCLKHSNLLENNELFFSNL